MDVDTLAAPMLAEARAPLPRDGHCVVFVLAPGAPAHSAVKDEILLRAQRLAPGDLFNVVTVSAKPAQFAEAPVSPCEDSFAGVRAWLEAQPERSEPNIAAAMDCALATPEVTSVVLVADGQGARELFAREELRVLAQRERLSGVRLLAVTARGGRPTGSEAVAGAPPGLPKGEVDARQWVEDELGQ
jgi:hypothetical protein